MRKCLSVVMVIAMILSSFTMAFAVAPPDVAGTDYEESVSVLMDLGVINGYEDGSYKPDRVVTRAEMAKLIIVALGLEDNAVAVTSKFPDMAGATWAQGFVAMASDLGIVIGYPDGTFKPSSTVTYNEAITMILRALGYTDASLVGSWPTNYVVKAKLLGVLEGMEGRTGGANRGDIAMMLFQSLALDIGSVKGDGTWAANDGDNFLTRLGAEIETPHVITGEEETAINLRPYVGAYAETYLNGDSEIIAVAPQTTFITGEYDGAVFTSGDQEYSVSSIIADTARPCFENGVQDGTNGLDDYADETVTLAVELSGKTIKMIYSIARWTATADDLFTSADADDISDDSMLLGASFMLDDNDDIDLDSFELVGISGLSKIAADDVVYIYADDRDYIRKVAVGTEVVTGKITKVSSSGEYTIGGAVYTETDENVSTDLEGTSGDEVKARLDAYGDIYTMEIISGLADEYAIALAVGNGTGSDISGFEPKINLFLSTGAAKAIEVDETETDLEALYFTNPSTPKIWVEAPAAGTIVKYGLNDDDVIDIITEISTSATSNLTAKGYFNGYAIASDATIFTYSGTDASEEDNYQVRELGDVLDMTSVTAKYAVDPDSGKIAAMLILSGLTDEESFGVVVGRAMNTSSAGYEITFLIEGMELTYNAKQVAYDAAADDTKLYQLNFNLAGDIASITEPDTFIEVTDASIDDYILTSGSNNYTLDMDVIIYKWDFDDDVFVMGSLSDVENAIIYDAYDEDSVYDIIVIPPVM